MSFQEDLNSAVSGGDYGAKLKLLDQLRTNLQNGSLPADQYLQFGKQLAQSLNNDAWNLSNSGSGGAQNASQIVNALQQKYFFNQDPSNTKNVVANLPDQYNKQLTPGSTGPTNLPAGTNVAGIPNNISPDSDQYKIEQEGARQAQQQTDLAATQKGLHASNLNDYAKLLATNQNSLFNREVPQLAEQANTKGIFRSTGFGDSLAKEYSNLTADTQNKLGLQAIAYGDQDTAALGNAVNIAQSYQGQGLNRQFSLDDYNKQKQDTIAFGKQFQPIAPSGGSGKVGSTLGGAATGGIAGSALGPWGTAIGAGLGAVGGGSSAKGK